MIIVLVSQNNLKTLDPRRHNTQATSIESVRLRWLVGGARGPLWRGTRLEEIGQIGLKPALTMANHFCALVLCDCVCVIDHE